MNRINNKGMELIQYKLELSKDYPALVKQSLLLALEQKLEHKILDLDAYYQTKDDTILMDGFQNYLLENKDFNKSDEEVFQEFEVIRNTLNEKLAEHEVVLRTESIIDRDIIVVTKKFCIGEQFTMNYFGVEEVDLLKLMQPKSFIEKFAVLRLTVIFQSFMKNFVYPKDLFNCDVSLVYFDNVENGYSIDFQFEINIEDIEKYEKLDELSVKIKEIESQVEEFYNSKTII